MNKPKEFWIGETDAMFHVAKEWFETQDWDFDVVHVIEYSAYAQAVDLYKQKLSDISQLIKERDTYKRVAEEWMAEYDKVKARYEPLEAVMSKHRAED